MIIYLKKTGNNNLQNNEININENIQNIILNKYNKAMI